MKGQWNLILGILFALIVAIFAVINVEKVTVDLLFMTASLPLIIIIIGAVFMGGFIVGSVGLYRMFVQQRQIKALRKENEALQEKVASVTPREEVKKVNEPEADSKDAIEEVPAEASKE